MKTAELPQVLLLRGRSFYVKLTWLWKLSEVIFRYNTSYFHSLEYVPCVVKRE